MHANGRLTAPPHSEAVLVTNSFAIMALEGNRNTPPARGNILDNSNFVTGLRSRTLRGRRHIGCRARFIECAARKFDPVSATQLPSVTLRAASGS